MDKQLKAQAEQRLGRERANYLIEVFGEERAVEIFKEILSGRASRGGKAQGETVGYKAPAAPADLRALQQQTRAAIAEAKRALAAVNAGGSGKQVMIPLPVGELEKLAKNAGVSSGFLDVMIRRLDERTVYDLLQLAQPASTKQAGGWKDPFTNLATDRPPQQQKAAPVRRHPFWGTRLK